MSARLSAASQSCKECAGHSVQAFCNFKEDAMERLEVLGMNVAFPAGAILYREGDYSESVAIVCEGQVKLSCSSRAGRSLILRIAGSGELLGLSSVITGTLHETSAEVIAPTRLKVIPKASFLNFFTEFPEVGTHSARTLALEYQLAFIDAKRLALSSSAEARLGKVLLDWGRSVASAQLRFQMALSHAELGEMAGLSRETVTRTLSVFRKNKVIDIKGATIRILKPEVLDELCM